MNTHMNATPRPWHVGVKQAQKIVYDSKGWAVCNCTVYHDEGSEPTANAKLIVNAVNSFEAMKEVLDNVREAIEMQSADRAYKIGLGVSSWDMFIEQNPLYKNWLEIKQALARAEGKE